MTEKEKMLAGNIYDPADSEIITEQLACQELLYDFNMTRPCEYERRAELLGKMLGAFGDGSYIEPPLHANWGGRHVFIGSRVYANSGLTLVDDGNIYIGNKVMIGPNVTVATAGHPILPELREKGLQFNKDIHICNNVWLGAGVIICPGVTVGENSVIGAGSVVTKDIPPNSVAMGVPCRVTREIGERDKLYFYRDERI